MQPANFFEQFRYKITDPEVIEEEIALCKAGYNVKKTDPMSGTRFIMEIYQK